MSSKTGRPDDRSDRDVRRIRGDLKVSGVLRIGSDTIIEGSVVAPGGVVFGDRVTVEGDVITQGAIEMGKDCHVLGRLNPMGAQPTAPMPQAQHAPKPDIGASLGTGIQRRADDELRFATLETSLTILFSLAQEGLEEGATIESGVDWGLPKDALEDMVAGLEDFMGELFRGGDGERPWSSDEVFNVLLKKVIGLIAPISLERESEDRAVLRIGRPTSLMEPERASQGWVRPLLAVIHLLGSSVHEDFRIEPLEPAEQMRPTANPARIMAMVRL